MFVGNGHALLIFYLLYRLSESTEGERRISNIREQEILHSAGASFRMISIA